MASESNPLMWTHQSQFRVELQNLARSAFESIEFRAAPRAHLVGYDRQRAVARFEPSSDLLSHLEVAALFGADPVCGPAGESLDRERALALTDAFEYSVVGSDRHFFVGGAGLVNDRWVVHPVLSIPRARWDQQPALTSTIADRFAVEPGLHHALVREVLTRATGALRQQQAPEGLMFQGVEDLVSHAAKALTQSVAVLAGHALPTTLHSAMDALASHPYEGRTGVGRLLLARDGHPEVNPLLRFSDPIPVHRTAMARKALEMSGEGLFLLCDGAEVFGLGTRVAPSGALDESVFEFHVVSPGTWELIHRGAPLVRVAHTRPKLPQPRISEEDVKDLAARIFPSASEADVAELWRLARLTAEAGHGTMVVVHSNAAAEAQRLHPQARRLRPAQLPTRAVRAVTSIDGAVLVDPQGNCHAIGVILDGAATSSGDEARGARYNSAVRYQHGVGDGCLVLVVSDDGMIDVIPHLTRRVPRAAVERPLTALEAALIHGTDDEPDHESFYRAWHQLEALSFYLTEDQCQRANSARQALEMDRADLDEAPVGIGRLTHVAWEPFTPHPDMNSSYYLDS